MGAIAAVLLAASVPSEFWQPFQKPSAVEVVWYGGVLGAIAADVAFTCRDASRPNLPGRTWNGFSEGNPAIVAIFGQRPTCGQIVLSSVVGTALLSAAAYAAPKFWRWQILGLTTVGEGLAIWSRNGGPPASL